MKKIIVVVYLTIQSLIWCENVNISQIDSSGLMLKQEVSLYVQVTNNGGRHISGLKAADFVINESNDFKTVENLTITDFKEGSNIDQGINFLLLVDNSGSMYRTIDNKLTSIVSDRRISIAKEAIKNFVKNSVNPRDSVALASFNTDYIIHSNELKSDGLDILNEIVIPGADNKTELYASLINSIEAFKKKRGRKVVIVLSDGENVPYGKNRRVIKYTEVIDQFQKNGITIFAINLAGDADKKLVSISNKTGGYIFNANNQKELNNIYSGIKNQVVTEYLITYKATMLPGIKRFSSVNYKNNSPIFRPYYSSTVFGRPLTSLNLWLFILPIIALGLMYLLWRSKFDKLNVAANIEILDTAPGVSLNCSTVILDSHQTIIGGNDSADLTIAGSSEVVKNHAVIVYDDKKNNYTVVCNEELLVNNRPTNERTLESGDVINIAGTTIIFDDEVTKSI